MSYIVGAICTLAIIMFLSAENDKTNHRIEQLEKQIEQDSTNYWDSSSKRKVE